jgi:hypothetical protein
MKVKDFSGNICNWPPVGHIVNFDDIRPRSQYHLECRRLLHNTYPLDTVLEEVPLPGVGLFLDFYTPHNNTAYEVNGEQHEQFNSYFYHTKADFLRAKQNDSRKAEWCQLNNIKLKVLCYKDMDKWQDIING